MERRPDPEHPAPARNDWRPSRAYVIARGELTAEAAGMSWAEIREISSRDLKLAEDPPV